MSSQKLILTLTVCALPLLAGCAKDAQELTETWESEKRSAFQALRDRKYDQSIRGYQRAIEVAEQIDAKGGRVASTYNELARVYIARGDMVNAGFAYEKAIAILDNRESSQHLQTDSMVSLCDALEGLANIKVKNGDLKSAEELYAKAVRITSLCNSVTKQRELVYEYKSVLAALGKDEEARKLDEEFKSLSDQSAVPNAQDHLQEETNKHLREAATALAAGNKERADKEYEEAMRYALQSKDAGFRGSTEAKVGLYLFGTGRKQKAEQFMLQGIRDLKEAGTRTKDMHAHLVALSNIQTALAKYGPAEKAGKLSLKIAEGIDPEGVQTSQSLAALVTVYTTQHQYAKAIPLFERSYAIHKKLNAPAAPPLVLHTCWMANLYWLADKKDKARACIDTFIPTVAKSGNDELILAGRLMRDYAKECLKQQQPDEASIFVKAADKIDRRRNS